ncbi:MAG TPA: hypothetical protein VLG76_05740 [Rhabdochlamydiaceae bacterium]|nr:hypothetical protein [Rhabdochlamydiaceae bacterium]
MFELLLALNTIDMSAVEKPAVEMVATAPVPHWELPHAFHLNFANDVITSEAGNISAETGPGVWFNRYYPWNWMMAIPYHSYLEIKPVLTKEEAEKSWNLILSHLSSLPGNSPISIKVNGKIIARRFFPAVNGWREDYFPIQLNEGENKIIIRLLNAGTHYWIQKLYIDPI